MEAESLLRREATVAVAELGKRTVSLHKECWKSAANRTEVRGRARDEEARRAVALRAQWSVSLAASAADIRAPAGRDAYLALVDELQAALGESQRLVSRHPIALSLLLYWQQHETHCSEAYDAMRASHSAAGRWLGASVEGAETNLAALRDAISGRRRQPPPPPPPVLRAPPRPLRPSAPSALTGHFVRFERMVSERGASGRHAVVKKAGKARAAEMRCIMQMVLDVCGSDADRALAAPALRNRLDSSPLVSVVDAARVRKILAEDAGQGLTFAEELRKLLVTECVVPQIHDGELRRKEHVAGLSSWANRYCVLDGEAGTFSYFPKVTSPAASAVTVQLSDLVSCFASTRTKHQGRGFKLVSRRKSFYFLAESRITAIGWVESINRAAPKKSEPSGAPADDGGGVEERRAQIEQLEARVLRLQRERQCQERWLDELRSKLGQSRDDSTSEEDDTVDVESSPAAVDTVDAALPLWTLQNDARQRKTQAARRLAKPPQEPKLDAQRQRRRKAEAKQRLQAAIQPPPAARIRHEHPVQRRQQELQLGMHQEMQQEMQHERQQGWRPERRQGRQQGRQQGRLQGRQPERRQQERQQRSSPRRHPEDRHADRQERAVSQSSVGRQRSPDRNGASPANSAASFRLDFSDSDSDDAAAAVASAGVVDTLHLGSPRRTARQDAEESLRFETARLAEQLIAKHQRPVSVQPRQRAPAPRPAAQPALPAAPAPAPALEPSALEQARLLLARTSQFAQPGSASLSLAQVAPAAAPTSVLEQARLLLARIETREASAHNL